MKTNIPCRYEATRLLRGCVNLEQKYTSKLSLLPEIKRGIS
jgi:hypothetical protein